VSADRRALGRLAHHRGFYPAARCVSFRAAAELAHDGLRNAERTAHPPGPGVPGTGTVGVEGQNNACG